MRLAVCYPSPMTIHVRSAYLMKVSTSTNTQPCSAFSSCSSDLSKVLVGPPNQSPNNLVRLFSASFSECISAVTTLLEGYNETPQNPWNPHATVSTSMPLPDEFLQRICTHFTDTCKFSFYRQRCHPTRLDHRVPVALFRPTAR